MSTIFTKDGIRTFKDDMNSIFHSGNEAEHRFLRQMMVAAKEQKAEQDIGTEEGQVADPEPEMAAENIEEAMEIKAETPKPKISSSNDKKQEMLAHLKRVFK